MKMTDPRDLIQPVDLSHLSDDEHNALCPQGYHAPDGPAVPDGREPPTPLSPLERMPGTAPGDLDGAGRCWLWSAAADSLGVPAQWRLLRPAQSVHWDRWLPASVKHLPTEVE